MLQSQWRHLDSYAYFFHLRYPDEDAVEQALAQYYTVNNITAVDGIPPNV